MALLWARLCSLSFVQMPMKQPRDAILVAGSANLDFVVRAHHVPAPGETVLGRELAIVPGGKGANQAVACARAGGAATRMVAGARRGRFRSIDGKVSTRGRRDGCTSFAWRQAASGVALICLADDAENAITVAPGANASVARLGPAARSTASAICCCSSKLRSKPVTAFARSARDSGVKVLLNAAPARALA